MIDKHSSIVLLIDKYELTMLQVSPADGSGERQITFEVFSRHLPNERHYGVVTGIARVLETIRNFRLTKGQLTSLDFLDDRTLGYLRNYSSSGQVDGYHEEELRFPVPPILAVRGTLAERVILETVILSILNMDSTIASAATQMVTAIGGHPIIEAGSRRTHEEAAVTATHAAYLVGFSATPNLEAAARYNIPAFGTAVYVWTLLHTSPGGTTNGAAAFRAQTDVLGTDTTLLVDTYDITEGASTAIGAAGPELGGVRIDSGDLGVLTRQVRQQLDSLRMHNIDIVISSGLDEFVITALRTESADVYDVGTSVVAGSGAPTAGLVYRMVEVDGVPIVRRSLDKRSHGGAKAAIRTCRRSDTAVEGIVFSLDSEILDVGNLYYRDLTVPMMRNGEVVDGLSTLEGFRDHLVKALVSLPWEGLAFPRDEPVLSVCLRDV